MLYTHIVQLMIHTTYLYIAAAYLAVMLLIILAYYSQRVYTYHLDLAKFDTFSLRKAKAAKVSENFKFKFLGLMKRYKKFRPYQYAVFKKETFFLCPYEEMYSHFKLLIETFSYFVR